MVEGGQQIQSIETHLQTGSVLFDSDPKGALAAYYQAVSQDPSHIEGWNQIGRLLFDMQQLSEAEMVFRRVEQLATEQNLPDWAEMAAQNIELTSQTLQAPSPADVVEQNSAQNESVQTTVQTTTPEETKSIEDIGHIAAVAGLPEVTPSEQAILFDEVAAVPPTAGIDYGYTEQAPGLEQVPEPPAPAVAQQVGIAPVMTNTAERAPNVGLPVVSPMHEVAYQEPVTSMDDTHLFAPEPVASAPSISMDAGQAVSPGPAMEPSEFLASAAQAGVAPAPPPFANMETNIVGQPIQAHAQTVSQLQEQLHGQVPASPPMTFPAQPDNMMPPPQMATNTQFPPPSMVPPTPDAEMDVPRGKGGKIALMITGVVGAIGIGMGAAQYMGAGIGSNSGAPLIKSEDKLASGNVESSMISIPVVPKPHEAGRDQAYKIGMTHLVKGRFDEARDYLEKAESDGHAEAGYNLASIYAKGTGVDKDFKKAVGYLKKSAESGYYPSMTNLGLLYAQGNGVEQDFLAARALWLKAAAGEHPDAMHNLAVIYATGKGVDKDMNEAIKWYRKGANAGYVDSIANLGLIYANGNGVPRDFKEAKRLWEVAAGKGHKSAIQNLEKLNTIMAQQQP